MEGATTATELTNGSNATWNEDALFKLQPGHGVWFDVVRHSCGDAAHLHEEVLSEVVFGEFHPAIRAPLPKSALGVEA